MEAQNPMSTLFIFVIFGLIFYFMIYRPQAKRNKEHKKLMSELARGTEVLTAGGLIGKITKVTEFSSAKIEKFSTALSKFKINISSSFLFNFFKAFLALKRGIGHRSAVKLS